MNIETLALLVDSRDADIRVTLVARVVEDDFATRREYIVTMYSLNSNDALYTKSFDKLFDALTELRNCYLTEYAESVFVVDDDDHERFAEFA